MFVSADKGEEAELTLETERQMVRGVGWPCASALWLKDRTAAGGFAPRLRG